MEAYRTFANYYDKLMYDIDYKKWFNYIESIFSLYNKRPQTILEMACGTGNLTYYLCKKDYDVTCFDISQDMLSIAYNKLNGFKNIDIFSQDMVNFNFYKKFDAVLSVCDSINYILDEDDLYKVFINVYNHLNDGGIFIFDINSYYKLETIIGDNTFADEKEDIFYVWQNDFDPAKNLAHFYLTFFIKDKNGRYTRFDETHIEKAYKIREIMKILKKTGFKKIDYYDGLTFNNPNKMTERINFVVEK